MGDEWSDFVDTVSYCGAARMPNNVKRSPKLEKNPVTRLFENF